MPAELERQLWVIARRKFPNDPDAQRRYVYGALRATGWKPKDEKADSKEKGV